MIAVIDYGAGNLRSIRRALEAAGADVVVTSDPDGRARRRRGRPARRRRRRSRDGPPRPSSGCADAIERGRRPPASRSSASASACSSSSTTRKKATPRGLGLLPGRVRSPHGPTSRCRRSAGTGRGSSRDRTARRAGDEDYYYFVHSYVVEPDDPADVAAVSALWRGLPQRRRPRQRLGNAIPPGEERRRRSALDPARWSLQLDRDGRRATPGRGRRRDRLPGHRHPRRSLRPPGRGRLRARNRLRRRSGRRRAALGRRRRRVAPRRRPRRRRRRSAGQRRGRRAGSAQSVDARSSSAAACEPSSDIAVGVRARRRSRHPRHRGRRAIRELVAGRRRALAVTGSPSGSTPATAGSPPPAGSNRPSVDAVDDAHVASAPPASSTSIYTDIRRDGTLPGPNLPRSARADRGARPPA